MMSLNGTLSIVVGGDSGNVQFRNAVVRKTGSKWELASDTGNGLADVLLANLVAKGNKLPTELDRIYALLTR